MLKEVHYKVDELIAAGHSLHRDTFQQARFNPPRVSVETGLEIEIPISPPAIHSCAARSAPGLCCVVGAGAAFFYYSVRSINAKNELIRPGPSGVLEEGMV